MTNEIAISLPPPPRSLGSAARRSSQMFGSLLINFAICLFSPKNAIACPDIDQIVDTNCDGQLKIVAYGDSITYGTRDPLSIGYPGRLKAILPHAIVYNQGKPGESSSGGRIRAVKVFQAIPDPDYAIILEGVNDYWLDSPSQSATANNLRSIATIVSQTGGVPMIATLLHAHRFNQYSWISSVNYLIDDYALVDFFGLGRKAISGDNLHPSSEGYQMMADLVANTLIARSVTARPLDTDQDGVYDFEEDRYGTSNTVADTDQDGLSDGAELYNFGTNPLAQDTDGDGFSDQLEVTALHSNPLSPKPSLPEILAVEVLSK